MIDDNIEPSGNEEASQETGLLDSASVETEAVESNPQKTEISHLEASDEDDDSPLERPDWWPENFWKKDEAEPDLQAMAKSWGDLRKQISQGKHKAPADGNYDVAAFKDIPATTVRVRRLRDGFVQIIGQKVVYFRNFAAKNPNPMGTDPRPNEIIHLKEYSPLNTFYGIPDIKIVFVRIANVTASGGSLNQPESIVQAIRWVSNNASKYSIDAVSISQSSISTNNLARCTTDTVAINSVSLLNSQSIPVFAATGNDGLLDKVGFPSCVSGVIGVGALASTSKIKSPLTYTIFAKSTNRGPGLDIVAQGDTVVTRYNGTVIEAFGTSIASPIAASLYVNKNTDRNVNNFISTFSKVLTYPYISK